MNTDPDLIVLSAPLLTIIVGLVIPIVNGIITKITLSGGVKAFITLLASTVYAFLATATTSEGTAVFSMQTLWTGTVAFVVAISSYFGFYKPNKITSSTPDGKLGPNTGIGPS